VLHPVEKGGSRSAMTLSTRGLLGCVGLFSLAMTACGSSAAPPFDTLPKANLTAFRLQNYEPPAAAAAPGAAPAAGVPGLPPEIAAAAQALPGLIQQFLPPGVTLPGLPAAAAPAAAPAPAATVPRFPNRPDGFRILSQTQVIDEKLKQDLADILGNASNFQDEHANCMYAEVGLSFTSATGGTPNDMLISFSCNQVQAAGGFAWPHPSVGLKPDTVKKLAEVTSKLFPPGT
jgi:hypothetical protein